MKVRRRPKVPDDVVRRLHLASGERVLAGAAGPSGEWYVGTDLALHLLTASTATTAETATSAATNAGGGGRSADDHRLPWEEIERADWSNDTNELHVVEVSDFGTPEQVHTLPIEEPGRLLELLRERVTKSVVWTLFAPVYGRSGLSVSGRQSPSGKGPVSWTCVLGTGLDPDDPAVRRIAARTLEQARREVDGLTDGL